MVHFNTITKFAILLFTITFVEYAISGGKAFNWELYTFPGIVLQSCLLIIMSWLSTQDWEIRNWH